MKRTIKTVTAIIMASGAFALCAQAQFSGIGVQVAEHAGLMEVKHVIFGGPADKGGLNSGDVLLKIDGSETKGLNLEQTVNLLRGQNGSNISVLVRNPLDNTTKTISLVRSKIDTKNVRWKHGINTVQLRGETSSLPVASTATRAPKQPDYTAWQSIKTGMSEAQVIKVLGNPRIKLSTDQEYIWNYGTVVQMSSTSPSPAQFAVSFDNGKVSQIENPFNGKFSTDGSPTTSSIIYPKSNATFSHLPRNIDLRWYPASGKYPMTYKVEIATSTSSKEETTTQPSLTTSIAKAGNVRWRIKAINNQGESAWSKFHAFRFTK